MRPVHRQGGLADPAIKPIAVISTGPGAAPTGPRSPVSKSSSACRPAKCRTGADSWRGTSTGVASWPGNGTPSAPARSRTDRA
jgi:hypothetical protein